MFGLSEAWLYTAISGLLVAFGVFLRMDAKKDARRDDREAQAKARTETLEQTRSRRDEIETMDDPRLHDALSERVRKANRAD